MIVLRARQLPQQTVAHVCRTFSTEKSDKPKYWHAKFPDGKPRSFDEMPTVEQPKFTRFNPFKQHEIYPQWFKKYGYVVREPVGKDIYNVHTFHFDDFETVHKGDYSYYKATGKQPQRLSPMVLKDYREKNKELYDNIGLGLGDGDYVGSIRNMIRDSMSTRIDEKMEKVADDLIEIIRTEVGKGGEIDLLPWLRRWGFENVGLKFLDKRLGALSNTGYDEAEMMLGAAELTNTMVALTTLDPVTNYLERYQKVKVSEGYIYSAVKKYIEQIAEPVSKCAVKRIIKHDLKDAITVTLDGFQGALQTVPLTVLMALYNVARNKDVQAQAREQLVEYLPTKDSKYFSSKICPPDIIEHIFWETLRFSPPIIGSGRIIKSDMVLGGYTVPKETNVTLHFQVASRLEEFYEEPLKFNPSRFKYTSPDRVKKVFATGSMRACIGSRLATDTIFLILLKMLRNFEFSYDGGEIAMINLLHNEPEEPLLLKVKPQPV